MPSMPSQLESLSSAFSAEQENYLRGFFAGVMQRPFVGQNAAGQLTCQPGTGANLAAPQEEMFFGTPVSDLCAEELWKYQSNPLDLWDELLRTAASNEAPNAENRFRLKFHGLFHVAPAQDSFMLRMRVPGGVMTAAQLRGVAQIAEQWGNSRIDLTTRANIQLREFAPKNVVHVLNSIRRLGMSSLGSGADNIRNITASPISGYDPQELLDVQPYADAMQNYITHSRDLFGLPRKFNIAFDNGGVISVLADTNDIGFVAVRVAEGRNVPAGIYFRVLLCGITGHKQFATDCGLLLLPEQAVAVAAAMVRVFAENGDRTDRKKARLKYLLDRWGVERFLQETEKKLAFPVLRVAASECESRGPVDRAGHLGTHAQRQEGLSYIGVCVPVGLLSVEQARAIAEVAERFGCGELRLTVWQNLILPNVPTACLDEARAALLGAGLEISAGTVQSGTVACTGNRGCKYAAADTKSHALEIARSLDSAFRILQPVNLHVTGCSHSCAQHYVGDIGLMGVKVDGDEGYQVNLGGGADSDQAIARQLFPAMKYRDLLPALHALFDRYMAQRRDCESFLVFTQRHSIDELRGMCATQQGDIAS
ncbi:NirA family protein [Silvibacterium dinghuense]|nr:NirA family protein [Silvibacterium dinghuense]